MKNIFLFHGIDSYSVRQKIKLWQQEFIKKYGEEGVEILDKTNFNLNNFITNIEAVPFLSEKKLIIIKEFISTAKKEELEKIAKNLEKTPDFCVIVFQETGGVDKRLGIYKKIGKLGKIEEFTEKSPQEAMQWVLNKAKKHQLTISVPTANYLVNHCGNELWTLSNELEKLRLYANGQEITSTMIDTITIPSLSASIFKLTDKIAEKNSRQALQILKTLQESGEEVTKVFFMIVRHFRILIQIHDMLQKNEPRISIGKRLKQPPFVIQKSSIQSQNFDSQKLEKIYQNLLEIDHDFKTGKIRIIKEDNRAYCLAIEKLIINCCQ